MVHISDDGGMHPPPDGPALPNAPLDAVKPAFKLRDIPAAPARPAAPASEPEPATAVEPRGPEPDDGPRALPAARERFGHYIVLDQLGEGAMGVVLAAYDQHLDRKVALKLLRADIDDNNEGVHHRMRREAQAMARLSHPNVAQVYEAGEVDGHLFLAMEFIQGVTLRAWTLQRPRPWRDVLAVFLQAGAGLAAAHAAGLTHRDFKPEASPAP
jgi:serine/threonine protein kinase